MRRFPTQSRQRRTSQAASLYTSTSSFHSTALHTSRRLNRSIQCISYASSPSTRRKGQRLPRGMQASPIGRSEHCSQMPLFRFYFIIIVFIATDV